MGSSRPDIQRLLEFHKLLEQFSQIERIAHRRHHENFVQENDTEHSYNLAMMAWFLSPHFPHLDRDLLIRIALVHDLVEIHAGDTYVYADAAALATKHEREMAALNTLRNDWADFPELIQLIATYEKREPEESKFVYALDKIMPLLMIYNADGYSWKKAGITLKRLDSVKRDKVALSADIAPYYDKLYDLLSKNQRLFS